MQPPGGVVETRLHRSGRGTDAFRDLLDREIGVEAQNDDHPMVWAEAVERPIQRQAVIDIGEGVSGPGNIPGEVDLDRWPPAAAAQPVATAVDQDAGKPRLKAVRVVERAGSPPGSDDRIMGRVLGLDGIAQDDSGEAVCPIELAVGEPNKGCPLVGCHDSPLEPRRHHAETMLCMFYLTIWAGESFKHPPS
jgi:hypothetical protein